MRESMPSSSSCRPSDHGPRVRHYSLPLPFVIITSRYGTDGRTMGPSTRSNHDVPVHRIRFHCRSSALPMSLNITYAD